ncbi:MAG: copper homeostasis protein CutC [Sphingomonas sp.]
MARTLEVCVDSAASVEAARQGGANRIELCGVLALGGLTPSPGLIALAARQPLPCHAMVRPREGDFVYDAREVAQMEADIAHIAAAGLAGVVFGATRDGALDAALLARLIAATEAAGRAAGYRLSSTLHRAIDVVDDPVAAIDVVATLGFDRVLTSGGATTALAGIDTIAAMHARAAGRLAVMAGSGVNADTVGPLLAVGIEEVHASCSEPYSRGGDGAPRLGFAATVPVTRAERVRALRDALDRA